MPQTQRLRKIGNVLEERVPVDSVRIEADDLPNTRCVHFNVLHLWVSHVRGLGLPVRDAQNDAGGVASANAKCQSEDRPRAERV